MLKLQTSIDRLIDATKKDNIPLVLWGSVELEALWLSLLKLAGIQPVCFGSRSPEKTAGNVYFKGLPIYDAKTIIEKFGYFNILLAVKRSILAEALNTVQNSFGASLREVFIMANDQMVSFHDYVVLRGKKSQLHRTDFTILCNSCTAGKYYTYLGMTANTPTQKLIIYPAHYLKLLNHLEEYMACKLEFSHKSIDIRAPHDNIYPVGKLNDVEIHFVHDKEFDTAYERWNTGLRRMNWENLFILFDDVHFPLSYKLAQEFDRLPYKNKIFLTRYNYSGLHSVCRYDPKKLWPNILNFNAHVRYDRFDLIRWLNEGGQGSDFELYSITDDLPSDYVEWCYNGGISFNRNLNDLQIHEIGNPTNCQGIWN